MKKYTCIENISEKRFCGFNVSCTHVVSVGTMSARLYLSPSLSLPPSIGFSVFLSLCLSVSNLLYLLSHGQLRSCWGCEGVVHNNVRRLNDVRRSGLPRTARV